MTLLAESTQDTGLNLDKRQRAMLKEMGVQVWQPQAKVEPVAQPRPEPLAAPVATPAPQTPPSAIDSGAARAHIQRAAGTFDTLKQAFQAPKTAPEAPNTPRIASGASAWRIGKLQTLYTPQSVASAARWLVLLESPASALQEPFNPFDGDAGKLLDNMLRAAHLHTAGSAMLAPLVRGNNAGGSGGDLPVELTDILASAKADVVLVMGRLAAQAVLQSTEPLVKLRGQIHRLHSAKTIITIDPTYLLRNPLDKAKAWDDLCLAISAAAPS